MGIVNEVIGKKRDGDGSIIFMTLLILFLISISFLCDNSQIARFIKMDTDNIFVVSIMGGCIYDRFEYADSESIVYDTKTQKSYYSDRNLATQKACELSYDRFTYLLLSNLTGEEIQSPKKDLNFIVGKKNIASIEVVEYLLVNVFKDNDVVGYDYVNHQFAQNLSASYSYIETKIKVELSLPFFGNKNFVLKEKVFLNQSNTY